MLVHCKDRLKCDNIDCPHYFPHKYQSSLSTCSKGNCHMLEPDRLVETWCVTGEDLVKPSWEV